MPDVNTCLNDSSGWLAQKRIIAFPNGDLFGHFHKSNSAYLAISDNSTLALVRQTEICPFHCIYRCSDQINEVDYGKAINTPIITKEIM
jgi:hypothetical protein